MSAQLLGHSEAAGHRPKAGLPDIDAADRDNPLAATTYVCDIFSYWKRCEPMFRVGPEYMSRQVPQAHAPTLHIAPRTLQQGPICALCQHCVALPDAAVRR